MADGGRGARAIVSILVAAGVALLPVLPTAGQAPTTDASPAATGSPGPAWTLSGTPVTASPAATCVPGPTVPVPNGRPGEATYPPPPASFDPRAGTWISSYEDDEGGIWRSALDGSAAELLVPGLATDVVELADGRVVFRRIHRGGGPALSVAASGGGGERSIGIVGQPWAVASGAAAVLHESTGRRGRDRGAWSLAIDGGERTRVLPPLPRRLRAEALLVSPDGGRILRLSGPGLPPDGVPQRMDGSFDGHWRRLPDGRPVGFDTAGDVVLQVPGLRPTFIRYRVADRSTEELLTLDPGGPAFAEARLVADGRFLAVVDERVVERAGALADVQALLVVDLVDGSLTRWPLDGAWSLLPWGTPDTVMLQGWAGDGSELRLVVSPKEGWTGYLPPLVIASCGP